MNHRFSTDHLNKGGYILPIKPETGAFSTNHSFNNQTVIETSFVHLVLSVNSSGKVLYISSNCDEILGFSQSELIGSYIKSFIHEDDQFLVESYFFNEATHEPCTFRMLHKDGNHLWVDGKIDLVKKSRLDKAEEFLLQVSVNGHDRLNSKPTLELLSTTRQDNSEMLFTNEDSFSLVEVTPYAVILAKHGKIVYVNEATRRLLGARKKEEINGLDIYQFALEPFHSVIEKRLKSIHDGYTVGVIEEKWRRLDHTVIDVDVRLSSVLLQGQFYEYFVLDDISSRKNFQGILQKSRERYQNIIHNSIDTIAVVYDNRWVFINESGVKMFEAGSYTEMLGTSIHSYLHPDEHSKVDEMISLVLTEKKERKSKQTWCTSSGKELYSEQIFIPTTYFGEPAIQVIIRDITERKQAEELMLKSEKLSIAGQLAAGIAHEIRNPLTAIKGFFHLIKTDQQQQYFDIVESELNRIEAILSELLVLSKPTEIKFKRTNIELLIKDVMTLLETQAIMNNIQLLSSFPNSDLFIMCDENQIKQVFINLIKNAIDAMPSGGVITISIVSENNHVMISVQDEGIGIPEHVVSRIGEPFYTTKEKGTGLGLMVSFKIIENHQGTFSISSEINKGTVMTVALPLD
jgi:two-component system, sporulation sensor kinase A